MSNILEHTPAEIVAQMLVDLGQANKYNLAGSWPVFFSQQPVKPDNLVVVTNIGGRIHGRNHLTGWTRKHFGIEVAARSVREGNSGDAATTVGWEKINQICNALDSSVLNRSVTVSHMNRPSVTYIVHACTRINDIRTVGPDNTNSQRYLFPVVYNLAITQQ